MNNPLYLFVGKSASGKTTAADLLERRYGYKQVYSYCTRKPRYEGEIGHVFISEDEFKQLGELAAYTFYHQCHYGTTFKQLDECSIYVIDPAGVKSLLKKLSDRDSERAICIFYFDSAVSTRIDRMIDRGDSDMQIIARLRNDDTTDDWCRQLDKLVWHYKNIECEDIELHKINANENIENVLEQILYYINQDKE